ncbi:MAG: ribosomal-processing cysteine protease Prp [Oscillospiraceae bacterium]|nr:ribosomal-processing cysteine protease Prp [Oscillospiraceae bacterium]
MIIAKFYKNGENKLLGFEITGHAGYDDMGLDIVCASVSSAAMLTCNTVTEVFKLDARVQVAENTIMLKLVSDKTGEGDKILLGFMIHMICLSEDYPQCIKVMDVLK